MRLWLLECQLVSDSIYVVQACPCRFPPHSAASSSSHVLLLPPCFVSQVWLRLLEWQLSHDEGGKARATLDRALQALPKRKHIKVWTSVKVTFTLF